MTVTKKLVLILFVKLFLAKYNILVLHHTHFSPDLKPWNFYVSQNEFCIKIFQSLEYLKVKATRIM